MYRIRRRHRNLRASLFKLGRDCLKGHERVNETGAEVQAVGGHP
jgi:hypothetical protein